MASFILATPQVDVLSLLYEQYRLYTIDLGRTHEGLGKLYKKVTKLDNKLQQAEGQTLSRTERRKLTWSRSLAKQSISNLLTHQAEIYGLLQQCRDLIASYNTSAHATPGTPWTTYLPVLPYTPGMPLSPWPGVQSHSVQPQYWDLSMLYHPADVLPILMPTELLQDTDIGGEQHPHHPQCHELMGDLPIMVDAVQQQTGNVAPDSTVDPIRANKHRIRRSSEAAAGSPSWLKTPYMQHRKHLSEISRRSDEYAEPGSTKLVETASISSAD